MNDRSARSNMTHGLRVTRRWSLTVDAMSGLHRSLAMDRLTNTILGIALCWLAAKTVLNREDDFIVGLGSAMRQTAMRTYRRERHIRSSATAVLISKLGVLVRDACENGSRTALTENMVASIATDESEAMCAGEVNQRVLVTAAARPD